MRHSRCGARGCRLRTVGTRSRGQAVIAATLVSLLMLILGMAVLMVAQSEYRSAVREKKAVGVLFAAQSGIEFAAAMLRASPPGTPYQGGRLPLPINRATVMVSRPLHICTVMDVDTYDVRATARFGTLTSRVQAEIEIPADRKWSRITSWKEGLVHRPRVPPRITP